jgi:hypothetical protein
MNPRLIAAGVLASLWLHRLTWRREKRCAIGCPGHARCAARWPGGARRLATSALVVF